MFLCFNAAGSDEYRQCIKWWGADRIQASHGFDGAERPRYKGLLFNGLADFVAPARFAGAVVEFGILRTDQQEAIFMLDYWLRFGDHTGVPESTLEQVRGQVLEAFTPAAPAWRESVSSRIASILSQALTGLQDW